MKLKILITGKNRKIASNDLARHLEKELVCEAVECQPVKTQLFNTVYDLRPDIVLIFVKDEDQNDIKIYDVITECEKFHPITVIAVADEMNRKVFTRNSRLRRILFLPSDISLPRLCDRINEVKREIDAENEKNRFVEFNNSEVIEEENRRKHILVVDDDPQQLMQIKEHLRDFYVVTLINSGTKVLKCLERFSIDLIFLDYLMPEMTGPEVLMRIRDDGRYADIPVVFLTGVSEKQTVIKTIIEFKPQGYILKPTTKIDIITKVIEILG